MQKATFLNITILQHLKILENIGRVQFREFLQVIP